MLFLIEYDRPSGQIVSLQRFSAERRAEARKIRLDIEIDLLRRGVVHEVVLLEAESEEAVRRTHRRYFESLESLATAS